jgi:hypothetical protein
MNRAPDRIDRWDHVELGTTTTTTIWSDDECVAISRTVNEAGRTQETSVRFAHGSEVERLIAAPQRARDRHSRGDNGCTR